MTLPLQLTRPLNFIDIEGTGTDTAKDKIVTLDIVQVHVDGTFVPFSWKFNPGVLMSDEVVAIHNIPNAIAAQWPLFDSLAADQILTVLSNHDVAGYNVQGYDISILWEELFRVGKEWDLKGVHVIDACTIYKRKDPRDLPAAVRKFCGREHEKAHSSLEDVKETINVLAGQLAMYADLPANVKDLAEFCKDDRGERVDLCGTIVRNKDGVAVFNTKRNRGVPVTSDEGYARWILRSEFPQETKKVLREILDEECEPAGDPRQGGLF